MEVVKSKTQLKKEFKKLKTEKEITLLISTKRTWLIEIIMSSPVNEWNYFAKLTLQDKTMKKNIWWMIKKFWEIMMAKDSNVLLNNIINRINKYCWWFNLKAIK